MNWTSKPFFIYCLIASLFLVLSGIGMLIQTGNPVPLILALPICGYFVYFLSRAIISKKPLPQGPHSAHADVSILIILIALVAGSTYTLSHRNQDRKSSSTASQKEQRTLTPTSTPVKQSKGKVSTDVGSTVRMRSKPSTSSEIVTTMKSGTEFTLMSEKDDWIEIQLLTGQKGWIKKEFTTIGQKEPR